MTDEQVAARAAAWARRLHYRPMGDVAAHHQQHGRAGNGRSPWLLASYCDIDIILADLVGLVPHDR